MVQKMLNDIYRQQLISQGKDPRDVRRNTSKVVPSHLQDRYSSWEEYEDAIHDFLNGN